MLEAKQINEKDEIECFREEIIIFSDNITISNPEVTDLNRKGAIFRKVMRGSWSVETHYNYSDGKLRLETLVITHISKQNKKENSDDVVKFGPVLDDSGVLGVFNDTATNSNASCLIKTGNAGQEVYRSLFTHVNGLINQIKLVRIPK